MRFRIKFQIAGEHFFRTVMMEAENIMNVAVDAEEVACKEQIRLVNKVTVHSIEVEVPL